MGLGSFLVCTIFIFWYWFSPLNLEVGYQPKQPVAYSHELHAGQLGIDCRYCHTQVEKGPNASIPSTEICMNCHKLIKKDSPEIAKLAKSYATGKPIEWIKIHNLPDYAYFDHSRHINAGVGCVSCHGRIDQMKVVHQDQPLSMGWCLECHRNPEKHVRPKSEITNMNWKADNQDEQGKTLVAQYHLAPKEDCSTCHR